MGSGCACKSGRWSAQVSILPVTLRLRRPRAVRAVRRSAVNNVWSCWWCSTERWCSTSTHSVSSGVSRHRVSSVCECAAREQCAQPPPCCSTANAGHTEYSYRFPSVAGAAARDVTALFPHNKTWRRAANQRARGHNGRPIGRRLPPRRPTIVRITMEPTTTGAGPQCRHPQLVRRSRYIQQPMKIAGRPPRSPPRKRHASWNFVVANWQGGAPPGFKPPPN